MEINFDKTPKIADQNVMRAVYDMLYEFEAESQLSYKYFDPYMPIAPTRSLFFKNTEKTDEIEQIPDIISKIEQEDFSFFIKEFPLNLILNQIVDLPKKSASTRISFALAVRSLTLLIQVILSKIPNNFKSSEFKVISKLIEGLPLPMSFFPSFETHYILNYGLMKFTLSSPTAFCINKSSVFIGTDRHEIYEISSKGIQFIYKVPQSMRSFSLIFLDDCFLIISPETSPAIVNRKTMKISPLRVSFKSTQQTIAAPCVTDSKFIYSYDNGIIKVYEKEKECLSFIRSVKLIGKNTKLLSRCAIATNGTFISFASQKKDVIRVFSLISGEFIGIIHTDEKIWGWAYDPRMNGHWVANGNGVILYENYSSLPYWMIDFPLPENNTVTGLISSYIIHFIGGGTDIPMSSNDNTVIPSILSYLDWAVLGKGEKNIALMNTFLVALQIKLRATEKKETLPFVQIYRTLMSCFSFKELRRHICFIFLSCIKIFTGNWTAECSYILERIIDEKSSHDLVFTYIQGAIFPITHVTPSIINKLASLCLETEKYSDKALILLSNLQKQLFIDFNRSQRIFIPYTNTVFELFTTKTISFYAGDINEEEFLNSNAFVLIKRLINLLYNHKIVVSSSIETFKKLFLLSLMKFQATSNAPKELLDLFDKILILALSLSIRRIRDDTAFINFTDGPKQDEEKIRELAEECGASKEEEKIQNLLSISRQTTRKMKNYLSTKDAEFTVINPNDSALLVFLEAMQWFAKKHTGNFKVIFTFFLIPFKKICPDLVCLPKDMLNKFANHCPVFLLLPKRVVELSGLETELQTVLSMRHSEIYEFFPNLLITTKNLNAKGLAQPFISIQYLMAPNETSLHRVLLLALLALNAKDADKLTEFMPSLRKVFSYASERVIKTFTEVCEKSLELKIVDATELFTFIFETIGLSMRNCRVFSNNKDYVKKLQYTLQIAAFMRSLLMKNNEELFAFIYNNINSFNDAQQIALFIITSNEVNKDSLSPEAFTNLKEINEFYENSLPCEDSLKLCLLLSSINFFAANESFALPSKLERNSFYNQYNTDSLIMKLLTEVANEPTNEIFNFISRSAASRSRNVQGTVDGSIRTESDPLCYFSSPINCNVQQKVLIQNTEEKSLKINFISTFTGNSEIISKELETNKEEIEVEINPEKSIVVMNGEEFQLFPSAEKSVISISLQPQTELKYKYTVASKRSICMFPNIYKSLKTEKNRIPSKLPRSRVYETLFLMSLKDECRKAFAYSIFSTRKLQCIEERTLFMYERIVSSVSDPFGEIQEQEIETDLIQHLLRILEEMVGKEENHFIWETNKTAIPLFNENNYKQKEFYLMPTEFNKKMNEVKEKQNFLIPKNNFRKTGLELLALSKSLYVSLDKQGEDLKQIKEIIEKCKEKGSPAFITKDLSELL